MPVRENGEHARRDHLSQNHCDSLFVSIAGLVAMTFGMLMVTTMSFLTTVASAQASAKYNEQVQKEHKQTEHGSVMLFDNMTLEDRAGKRQTGASQ